MASSGLKDEYRKKSNLLTPKNEHTEEKTGTSNYTAGGNFLLLVFGIAISIPIVLAGSTLLTKLMDKYAWLSYVGAGVLAWTAGEMVVEDKLASGYLHSIPYAGHLIPVVLVILVLGPGKIRAKKVLATENAKNPDGFELN